MTEPLVYTIEQVAQMLGVGRSTAYDAVRRGELPVVRLGSRLLVPKARLDQMLTGAAPDLPQKTNGAGVESAPFQDERRSTDGVDSKRT
jgi:excisionase family DNA binding protein